jgi:hypothetical protein
MSQVSQVDETNETLFQTEKKTYFVSFIVFPWHFNKTKFHRDGHKNLQSTRPFVLTYLVVLQ